MYRCRLSESTIRDTVLAHLLSACITLPTTGHNFSRFIKLELDINVSSGVHTRHVMFVQATIFSVPSLYIQSVVNKDGGHCTFVCLIKAGQVG